MTAMDNSLVVVPWRWIASFIELRITLKNAPLKLICERLRLTLQLLLLSIRQIVQRLVDDL